MKKIFFAFLLCPMVMLAQPIDTTIKTISSNAALTSATVYYGYGAELNHTSKAILGNGLQQIIISNISLTADEKTLQVSCPDNVVLMSRRIQPFTINNPWVPDAMYKKMQDSIKIMAKQNEALENDINTTQNILDKISKLLDVATGTTGKDINSDNIIKLADYYEAKIEVLQKKQFNLTGQRNELLENKQQLSTRISQYVASHQTPAKTIGQLILQVMATGAGNAEFNFSYFTPNAGWVASYDMRVKAADNSFKLGYRASVQQTTGLDWKQTKLTLSTSNPNLSNTMPLLSAWYLQPQAQANLQRSLQGKAPGIDLTNSNVLNEVVVVAYGTNRDRDDNYQPPLAEKPSYVETYLSLNESQLNTNFDIDLPYDIPTDGKQYAVAIKEETLKANYKHYAVPKLDGDAFLVAELADWESLSLLPGQANIIMDNVYLGQSFIDPNSTQDTLQISLGRDKRVSIKRSLVKDDNKNKTRGDNKYDYFSYELTVKNNKKQPLNLLLKDQYPISNIKDIEVTIDDENANADINKDLGILNWKIALAAGESKKIRFGYSIKYPKDMRLTIR